MTKVPRTKAKSTADVPFAVPNWPATQKPEMVRVDKITAHPKNPRIHPDGQLTALGEAFDEFGVVWPIVVDENYRLLAGEGRWLASKKKGIEEYPCIIVRGWPEAKKVRFMFADNHLPSLAGFDDAAMRAVAQMIADEGAALGPLGLDDAALAELLADPNAGQSDPDEVPAPPTKPVVRRGDLWALGEHRLLCGDSTNKQDVMLALGDAKPRLMVTDPPYGVDYDADWRNRADRANGKAYGASAVGKVMNDGRVDWSAAWKLFSGDVVYCWHADRHASSVQLSLESVGFEIVCQVIWAKSRMIISRGDYHWKHEPCWYAVRKGKRHNWQGDRSQTTLWEIEHAKSDTGHSTQKPIECMKRPIENNSQAGAHIYEPFSGSGTTIICCEMTGRKAIAIELDSSYVQVAIERWQAFTGKLATLDGKTLEQVGKARRTGRAKGAVDATKAGVRATKPRKPASVRPPRAGDGLPAAGLAPTSEP